MPNRSRRSERAMRARAFCVAMNCSGMGSVPGQSSRSHASVHSVRSMRAGLPVSERERTASTAVGREQAVHALRPGVALGDTQPDRTRPHARRAERHRRGHLPAGTDPARGEHRRRVRPLRRLAGRAPSSRSHRCGRRPRCPARSRCRRLARPACGPGRADRRARRPSRRGRARRRRRPWAAGRARWRAA